MGTKKGQLSLPFLASIRLTFNTKPVTKRYYLVALPVARAPNFLLNFSTRPAVSMIFC
ncbi:hypothetical protein P3T16_005320 [Paraburkholderia sp. GAS42]|jgi:hypothetical protein